MDKSPQSELADRLETRGPTPENLTGMLIGITEGERELIVSALRCARSENAPIMPSNEAVILAAKIVAKKGEFADMFTASTAGILLATEMLRLAYPNGVPEGLK